MRVYIETVEPFMSTVNVYFMEDTPSGTYIFHMSTEGTDIVWSRDLISEGVRGVVPTLQMNRHMLDDLRDALYPMAVKADEELVRRLQLEEGRVDSLMQSVITIAERRI